MQIVENLADYFFKYSPLVADVHWLDVSVSVWGQRCEVLEGEQRDAFVFLRVDGVEALIEKYDSVAKDVFLVVFTTK